MKTYTVILLYPDRASGDFGVDTYVATVHARDPYVAAAKVQRRAVRSSRELGTRIPAEDFRPVLVFDGDCRVAADATSF